MPEGMVGMVVDLVLASAWSTSDQKSDPGVVSVVSSFDQFGFDLCPVLAMAWMWWIGRRGWRICRALWAPSTSWHRRSVFFFSGRWQFRSVSTKKGTRFLWKFCCFFVFWSFPWSTTNLREKRGLSSQGCAKALWLLLVRWRVKAQCRSKIFRHWLK